MSLEVNNLCRLNICKYVNSTGIPGTTSYIPMSAFVLYFAFDLWVSVVLKRILKNRLPHPKPSRIEIACGKERETKDVKSKLLAEAGFKLEIRQKSITKGLYCK